MAWYCFGPQAVLGAQDGPLLLARHMLQVYDVLWLGQLAAAAAAAAGARATHICCSDGKVFTGCS
jgi:hypothetical protein